MSSRDLTWACAEYLGLGYVRAANERAVAHSDSAVWVSEDGRDWNIFDPLHDDDDAATLLKRHPNECMAALVSADSIPDINRAIVECVARIAATDGGKQP